MQQQPGWGRQGVLHAGTPTRSLFFQACELFYDESHLAAALLALPQLQHLSITGRSRMSSYGAFVDGAIMLDSNELVFPGAALQGLRQLTCLELGEVKVMDPQAEMQHLAHLTGLQELKQAPSVLLYPNH